MDRDDLIAELFGRWKLALKSGQPQTPEELCATCPDLLETFREVLPQLAAVDALFDDKTDVSDSGLAAHVEPHGYRSVSFHKEGGLGVVLVGEEVELRRTVAIKCMKSKVAGDALATDRFVQEAELTARLDHPGVVPIYRMGHDDQGKPYYSMRFVQGETLAEAIARFYAAKLPRAERNVEYRRLLRSLIAVCETIAFAHSRHVIHRDLKPDNIILGPFGETLVLDWGLAKRFDRPESSSDGTSATQSDLPASASATRTMDGTVKGAPPFMSPEQARGEVRDLGPPTDIYSLGATLFVLLTGKSPFTGKSALEIVEKVRTGPSPSARQFNPEVDKPLEAICRKAMSHKREDRYADARELARDLDRWLADEPVGVWREPPSVRVRRWMKRNRPIVAAITTGLMIVTIAVMGFAVQQRRNSERERRERERADASAEVAREERARADEKTKEAQHNLEIAQVETERANREARAEKLSRDRAEELTYVHQIRLAQIELVEGHANAAHDLLNVTRADIRGWEYRYLRARVNKARRTFRGVDKVECVAFSPDGKLVASGSWDTTVKIWDAQTGKRVMTLKGHTQRIKSIAFSHDGTRIASGSADRLVKVWDLVKGHELLTYREHADEVISVEFSGDDSRIVSGSREKEARLWDARTGRLIRLLGFNQNSVRTAAFIPKGPRIALVCDETIRVIDSTDGKELLNLKGHVAGINSVAVSSDGSRIVSAGWDNVAILWNAATGERLLTFEGHRFGVLSAAFSADGSRIVTSSRDGTVKVWDTRTGKETLALHGHPEWVQSVDFNSQGTRIATASWDATARIWDARNGQHLLTLTGGTTTLDPGGPSVVTRGEEPAVSDSDYQLGRPSRTVPVGRPALHVQFSPDGTKLAAALWDGTTRTFDARNLQPVLTLKGHTVYAHWLVFSKDGNRILTAEGAGTGFTIFDLLSGKEILYRNMLGPYNHGAYSIAFSPDEQRIAVGSDAYAVRICETKTGRDLLSMSGHSAGVTGVVYSPDGSRIYSSSYDNSIKIWNAQSGQEKLTLKGHTEAVWSIALNKDGTQLASASWDNTAKLWDARTGRELSTLRGHSDHVLAVAFSPDGQRIATGSVDKTIKIWNARNGQELLTLKGHAQKVNSVAFGPDGLLLASASDESIAIWDPAFP